jgi:hypothetical protein
VRRPLPGFSRILFLLFCICTTGSALLEAQGPHDQETVDGIPKIRVDVPLVTMDVTVIPAVSRNLSAEDFVVWHDGVAQQVTYFSRDLIPLSIAVVVDRSSSITNCLPLLQKAVLTALGHLKPEDQVALFTFDNELVKLKDFTVDHNLTARIVGSLVLGSAWGGTDIYRTCTMLPVISN